MSQATSFAFRVTVVISTGIWGVLLGPWSGFDLLNLRWIVGWSVLTGSDGLSGSALALATLPWFHDVVVASLLALGPWWIPPFAMGAVHGLIPILVWDCTRLISPHTSRALLVACALASLSTPIVAIHVGRETGHLVAAVFLLLALKSYLSKKDNWSWHSGLYLALACLAKLAASLSSLTILLLLIIFSRGSERLRLIVAFCYVCFLGNLLSSAVLIALGKQGFNFYLFGIRVSGVFGLAGLMFVWTLSKKMGRSRAPDEPPDISRWPEWRLYFQMSSLMVACFALVVIVRRIGFAEARFKPGSLGSTFWQFVMTANDRLGPGLQDSEILYRDNGRLVSICLLLLLLLFLGMRGRFETVPPQVVVAILASGIPIMVVMASMGYVRYASQSFVFIPVSVVALAETCGRSKRLKGAITLLFVASLLLPSASGLQWFRPAGMTSYDEYDAIIEGSELGLLNSLVPGGSTVFWFGSGVSFVAPALDRRDVTWVAKPKRPDQVGVRGATLIYDLADTQNLDKFTTRGWLLEPCSALRFTRVSIGWCELNASEGPLFKPAAEKRS